ncbi:MAG: C4-type zinc ribbon domain-containing protein [Candidatus Nanopelagicales bacterium]
MKASPAAQQQLLEVQDLDTRIDQLNHREATLPEAVELAKLDDQLEQLRSEAATAQVEVTDVSRALERADNDVQQVRTRTRKDQELLDSGSIASSKQLSELQHEISSLQRRQNELEDVELEVMEAAEQAQGLVTRLTTAIGDAQARRDELVTARDGALAALNEDRASSSEGRQRIAASVPEDLLKLYDKIRADQGGVGAAPLRGNRCDGCHMQISPIDMKEIAAAAPDEVTRCESCRRILIRPVPTG